MGIQVLNNQISQTKDAPIALHFAFLNRITGNSVCSSAQPLILVIKPGKSENVIDSNTCSK